MLEIHSSGREPSLQFYLGLATRNFVQVDSSSGYTLCWNVSTFVTKSMYLNYLRCVKKFGLPPYASCLVNRNVKDEECLPSVSVSNGCTDLF